MSRMALLKYVAGLVICNIAVVLAEFHCGASEHCMCFGIQAAFEFQCPFDQDQVHIKYEPGNSVEVQCLGNVSWDTQQLPVLEAENINRLLFKMCPFPTSFRTVMNSLGLNNTKKLIFDFSANLDDFTLSPDYFKNMENLEKLVLNDDSLQVIDDGVFRKLNKLTEIDLRSNNIQLTEDMFKHSSKLTLLDISQNSLSHLPSGLFQSLTELKTLYMWSNNLTTLNASVFTNLKRLELLELTKNQLQDLPEDAFYGLGNLKSLSLMMNKLHTVPENLFAKNFLLEVVNMKRNNYLTSLPNNFFANLTKLKTVFLNECNLRKVSNTLFDGSIHLKEIYLENNQLEQLPENIFKDLKELTILDLSYNKITSLSDTMFSSLEQLKTLNLENNMLTSISKNLFYYLQELETVNLKNNRIGILHSQSFQRLVKLKEIILSHNYLDIHESILSASPFNSNLELEKLDLSNNNITSISDDWITALVHLKELDLSYNHLTSVDFIQLITASKGVKINLMHNRISTVNFEYADVIARSQENQDAYSSNSANTVVYLDGNPIVCDCKIYDLARYFDRSIDPMVPTLVTVVADSVTCTAPTNFFGFPITELRPKMLTCALEQLETNSTCPKYCVCVVRKWDKSLIVDCEKNNLTNVPELILPLGNFYNHTEVHLEGNQLTSGPKENMGYENVTKLYLSSNNIEEIEWVPPQIKVLRLDSNNISTLNYNVLVMLNASTLTNVSLGNNPWDCNCSAMNLSAFLLSHLTRTQIDAGSIKCRSNGKLLAKLSTSDLCPTNTALVISLSVTFAVVALVIAALTALYYCNEQKIKVWLFAHNMFMWFVTEEEIDKDKVYDAFISYSHQDEKFVMDELLPVLEHGPEKYKLCVHVRDWVVGEFIPKQIARSVEESRRTVVILSPSFLQSGWGKMEFRTAHMQALSEGRARVIVILYGNIDLNTDLDDELKAYIKTNTYVEWGDPWFWDKLRYALPHSQAKIKKVQKKKQNIMMTLNDKLDLINIPTTPNPGSTPPAINVDPLLLKTNPLNFKPSEALTPPAESGLNPLLVTVNK